MVSRMIITAGIAVSAGFFLTACSGSEDSSSEDTTIEDPGVETLTSTAATAVPAESPTVTGGVGGGPQTGTDPVFGVIDAASAEHADGIIVQIDREDSRETYDIDIVVGAELIELEVDANGAVREDERADEDEDIKRAQAATVTAGEAIRQALEQHPGGVFDEAELDEEDGTLRWEINLDDAERQDLAEVTIPAN